MIYNNIAVIPARGGSKRIPRKNIKDFLGIPIIQRTIDILHDANIFEKILVSTDDQEIAEISIQSGAEVPFLRPRHLADDHTPTAPVIKDTIKKYCEKNNVTINLCCCVYPCNPMLKSETIIRAKNMLIEHNVDFVYPVCVYPHPIQRSMRIDTNGRMDFLYPEHELTRTQDLEECFHDAGQFYWGQTTAWLEEKRMHSDGMGMEIPASQVIDIDNEDDWLRAEALYKISNINTMENL